ncbi:hypothetical protein SLEP1_g33200 [Rubroshorea leprosula]|uniref:RNase H type-1 domain-containing protein n=1 Tax=Rubroshorea leprosula TaxID=152421 RepID=A0AAV5KFV8_9ROSI|nr:hypothetical protein SLEP1_g33200 [Rubroshorea leprosula]
MISHLQMNHVLRERNMAAHAIAKKAVHSSSDFVIL